MSISSCKGLTFTMRAPCQSFRCLPQDDYIEQDITVDPYLPIADNTFDFVIVPAMFQVTVFSCHKLTVHHLS